MDLLCVNRFSVHIVYSVCENPGAENDEQKCANQIFACLICESVFDPVLGVSRAATARYIFIYIHAIASVLSHMKNSQTYMHVQCKAALRRH